MTSVLTSFPVNFSIKSLLYFVKNIVTFDFFNYQICRYFIINNLKNLNEGQYLFISPGSNDNASLLMVTEGENERKVLASVFKKIEHLYFFASFGKMYFCQ